MSSEDRFKVRKYITEDNWQIVIKYPAEKTSYDDLIIKDIKQSMEELTMNRIKSLFLKGINYACK